MWVEIFWKCDNPCSETNAAKLCGPDAAIRFALYQQSFVTHFENTWWSLSGISTAVARDFINKPADRLMGVSRFDPGF